MDTRLLTAKEAAELLGISTTSLYDWLSQSDGGELVIRGKQVTIDYLQGGPRGQGRIKIEEREVKRLKELMRVRPTVIPRRRTPTRRQYYPGITVELGDPED